MKSIIKLFEFSFLLLIISCGDNLQLFKAETSRVEINSEISVDSTILKFIEPYKKNIEKDLYTTFAYSANTLDKKEGELNTAIGNMMADAVFELSNPVFKLQKDENIDFVLLNYGGIRSIISKGNINEKTAYNLMPFENEVVVTKLIGEDIYKLIDYLRLVKRAHPISGLNLELDKNYELINAKINNKNIDINKYYYVATSDFLLNGGDKMDFFNKSSENTFLNYKIRDLLIDYFIKIDTLKPKIDNRFIRTK